MSIDWLRVDRCDSTLGTAYSQLVTAIGDSAQDHSNLADSLSTQVIEGLRASEKRHEDAKKRQMQYFLKMLADRDKTYAERLKVSIPHRTLNVCTEVFLYSGEAKGS